MSSKIWKYFSFGPHSTIIFSLLDTVDWDTPAHLAHGVCPKCQDTTCHPGEQRPSVYSTLPTPNIQALEKDISSLTGSNMDQAPRWNSQVQRGPVAIQKAV